MTKTKSKSKTSKTNRKADTTPPKPQAKKGKMAPRKQSAKAKEEPADEPAPQTETAGAESVATTATTTATETPVSTVDAQTGETAAPTAAPTEKGAATSESRMPAIGTILQKRDRKGTLRCECEIVEGGVRYGGTVYRSLSSAAVAAAKDLGLAAKAMNGFTFWGVSKPSRPTADPLGGLERAWDKYQARLEAVLERANAGEHKETALTTLLRHARVLQNLHQEVAT